MKHHIFVFGETRSPQGIVSSRRIVSQLLRRGKWYCSELSPRWRALETGDCAVFYLAGKGYRIFVGQARTAGLPRHVDGKEKKFLESIELPTMQYFIPLEDVDMWKEPRSITPLIGTLSFTRGTRNYGGSFRGGIAEITRQDFTTITES